MKLHLGCGSRFIPGFVHIDAVSYPHVDHVSTIDRLSFIPDNSVALIYNCHVLEHFKRKDVGSVLSEWFRVLQPGGILRVAVPDFASVCAVYAQQRNLKLVIGPLFGRQDYLYNIHYNTFDEATLANEMRSAGFVEPARYRWQDTEHASVDDYSQAYIPHLDKTHGVHMSLNMECRKP